MTHYPKFFLNKGRILALWVMYTTWKQFKVQIIGILDEIDSFYSLKMHLWKSAKNLGRAIFSSARSTWSHPLAYNWLSSTTPLFKNTAELQHYTIYRVFLLNWFRLKSSKCQQCCTNRGSLAKRKWQRERENEEEMKREWTENEEMERDSLSRFPRFLVIPSLSIHFLYQKLSHFVAKC